MRTIFFKKMMMPLAVMVLGVGGAFTTTSMSSTEALSHVTGYKFISAQNKCQSSTMCDTNDTGTICTNGGARLWGKVDPLDTDCPVELYRIEE